MQCEAAGDFPWAGSHPWDVDIAIVGGGPAGLAAAIRLRWLKTMPPLPLTACLINSGPLGGLAKLGNSILTGPGLAFPAGKLVSRLQDDLSKWPLPVLSGKVISVGRRDDHFQLTLEDGRSLSAAAVIMACGMLDIRNMADFWRQGVVATFGNRANIFSILERELPTSTNPLILGGPHLAHLQQTIGELNANTTLLLPRGPGQGSEGNLLYGELVELRAEEGVLTHALIQTATGQVEQRADKVVVEFNSLELERSPLPSGLSSQENGYLETTGRCATATTGLFAAGDCTGPPFAALVALGQGAEAAFAAYRYVFNLKYKSQPALFAYFGDHSVTDQLGDRDDFPLTPDLVPARLLNQCPLPAGEALWRMIDGRTSIKELGQQLGVDQDELYSLIKKLLTERSLTFCPHR